MTASTSIRIGIETRLLAGHRTGIGNYSFHLLQALTSRYPELEYLGFNGLSWSRFSADELQRIEMVEAESTRERSDGKPQLQLYRHFANLGLARSLYRQLQGIAFSHTVGRQSLDLFHALYFIPPADPGVPVLPVIYDLSSVRYPETLPAERRRWLDRLPKVISKAPLVQTISEFTRNEIVSVYAYPKERIIVAPPAAAKVFRPLGRDATERDLKAFGLVRKSYLLAVGTLEPRKNLRTLIIAYAQLSKTERLQTPLAIVGGAGWGHIDLPKETHEMIQDGDLRFLGAVSDAQLRSLYEGAVALLFPSIYEGFGMPVVEAMSCGTPVVHSADTSMDEITGDLAIRRPAMDVDGWSSAMQLAIEQSQLDEQVDNPEKRAALINRAREFQWETSAARVNDAYTILT